MGQLFFSRFVRLLFRFPLDCNSLFQYFCHLIPQASQPVLTNIYSSLPPGNKDWSKIHKKEFSKFDSLDVYLEKKQQRKDLLSGSGKKVTKGISGSGNVSTRHSESTIGIEKRFEVVVIILFDFLALGPGCERQMTWGGKKPLWSTAFL